jgi:glycosyltransferase involved in cell wall biosynthesis
MRILFIATALHKEFGGPPVSIVGAATSLADLGNEVTIMIFGQSAESVKSNEDFYSRLRKHHVKVIVAKARKTSIYGGIGSRKDLKALISELKRNDVVSSHALYNFQNILLFFLLLYIPVAHTLMPHGTLTKYQQRIHRYRKMLVDQFFLKHYLKRVDGILVATQVEKDELNLVDQQRTFVAGLGVNLKLEPTSIQDLKISKSKFLFLGRIAPVKRLDLAIEAFALFVNKAGREYRLIICGDGNPEYVQSMKEMAHSLGVLDLVEFRGWIDQAEKMKVFEECDWLLVPSDNENFSNTVAEGLVFGIPCVVSKNVALSSEVRKEGAGEVIETFTPSGISESMHRIVQGNQSELRSAALRAGKNFKWDKVAMIWLEAFRKIIKNRAMVE